MIIKNNELKAVAENMENVKIEADYEYNVLNLEEILIFMCQQCSLW